MLSQPLYEKTLKDLSKHINVKISSLEDKDYSYSLLPVDDNQIDL